MNPAWAAARRDLGLALFVALILAAAFLIDRPVARLMARNAPPVVETLRFVSWFGQGGVVLVPAGLLVLTGIAIRRLEIKPSPSLGKAIANSAVLFAAVAAAGLINDLLKIVFGRARPFLWLAGDDSGFRFFRYGAKVASFPSGHTATSMAAAVVFGALFPRWRWGFIAFACLIAISRIGVGAHYPSDVVAGAAVGGFVAAAVVRQARRRRWIVASRRPESPLAPAAAKEDTGHKG